MTDAQSGIIERAFAQIADPSWKPCLIDNALVPKRRQQPCRSIQKA